MCKNALKQPGSSDAEGAQNNNNSAQAGATGLLNDWLPLAHNQLNFQNGLEGLRQHFTNAILGLSDPTNYYGQAQALGNQARSQGMQNANYAASMYGPNSGLAKGEFIHANNAGTQAQNNYLTNLYDPSSQTERYGRGLQAIAGAGPNYNTLQGLSSTIYGRPQVPVGASPLGAIAQLGGSFFGGPAGGAGAGMLFGGGNPNGTMPSSPYSGMLPGGSGLGFWGGSPTNFNGLGSLGSGW